MATSRSAASRAKVEPKAGPEPAPKVAAQAEPERDLVDRVACVTRDADGNPVQSPGYVVLVADDASDEEKAAAHNRPKA